MCSAARDLRAEIPEPYNSEKSDTPPLPAVEAAARWQLPEGFKATAFASEPDVRQPIAMAVDGRGRVWVAENYSYGPFGDRFTNPLRDRIVILEDTDGDGVHDKRTVFADNLHVLSSVEVGFGGVWALALPNLIFIPDRDGDDKPDGPPEVVLDGWDLLGAHHTMANGLRWGPDGWLYGRQGIVARSLVGKPGAPASERLPLSVCIWRYHPVRKTLELVCEGTTNPWGMDWNGHGELFFINTVIGHLWHAIPGAHFKRMFGEDANPRVYQLIDQHADHYHWDTREKWSDVRTIGITASSSSAGGGHAHTGLMIYQGDNWPDSYRGGLFTINFHGRRLNRERLERVGGGYVAKHTPDLAQSADPWFRGVDLLYGPDGGVFISDWSDTGECHDDDAIHRQSGRIYKITHGAPKRVSVDAGKLSPAGLVEMVWHKNEYLSRLARRQIQERAVFGGDLTGVREALARMFAEGADAVAKLRALWALHLAGATDAAFLRGLLTHSDEHVRAWAVRLLLDDAAAAAKDAETARALAVRAADESSAFVRLALASALQRLPADKRAAVAEPLVRRAEDAEDHNIPMMLWYGLQPLGDSDPETLAKLGAVCELPDTRRCVARRLTEHLPVSSAPLDALLRKAAEAGPAFQKDVLAGMSEALSGLREAAAPSVWSELTPKLANGGDPEVRATFLRLGVIFGDGAALEILKAEALNDKVDPGARRTALRSLIDARAAGLREICEKLFGEPELSVTAADGLSLETDPAVAAGMLARFSRLTDAEKGQVLGILISRPAWAAEVLKAMAEGRVPRVLLTAFHARQIRGFNDAALNARLTEVWGELRESSGEKQALVDKWKAKLTPEVLRQADLANGRALFASLCASCHKLYGEGADIGPDLTGGGRDNLDYLLNNIADPSAVMAKDYQLSIVTMKDSRVLSGILRARNDQLVVLQTLAETLNLDARDVQSIETSPISLMPEGLLDALSDTEARDLFGFLMYKEGGIIE